jgi:dihydrofolate synthase/folylpolyglutamate synthase
MFSQLPMYQNKGKSAYKSDLSNTLKLANYLNHPESKFKSIHVAGTNGKGSTSHMIASVLQESGHKVGLYTSPHLKDYRERIKINGAVISEAAVVAFIQEHKPFFEANQLSFFEMTVGMAFDYFAKEAVDIAVIEVGLGGRLDSTNIITPEVSIITNIGMDHTQFLGNTLALIAREKGGVIKASPPVVIGQTQQETTDVFNELAAANNAPIYYADQLEVPNYKSDLKGSYQKHNIKTAIQALYQLRAKGYTINEAQIEVGLLKVVNNTGLLGRWQVLQESPKVICDTAHNKEGLGYTLAQLQDEYYKNLHMVLGFVNDKKLDALIELFPQNASYYFCKPDILRGLDATELQHKFKAKNYRGNTYSSVSEALNKALNNATSDDLIYVGGSTFVVAEII